MDPLAILRAIGQLITRGHVVSGGSTLTMQVARLLSPHRHNLAGKIFDTARAIQLTFRYSKPQILQMYLTLAPYGGNIEGVRAASYLYFERGPEHLTLAQAALLVALPRSPEHLRPDRHGPAAIAAARLVLSRAGMAEDFSAGDLPHMIRHAPPALAPHLAAHLATSGQTGLARTTLDASLQTALVPLAARQAAWLGRQSDVAALVVRNQDRAIIGYIGGANAGPGGMVDMVRATRSPGSTLKPFIYGIALDDSLIVPDTLILDAPMNTEGYAPQDFTHQFHGLVTAREALQQSYNLPAVSLLRAIGPSRFVSSLRAAGATLKLPGDGAATLPVALGGVGISLQDLCMLYTGLADGGAAAPLRLMAGQPAAPTVPEMSAAAAAQISDMLRGAPLPDGVAPDNAHAIAYKTGTSYGFRDAWAAGFSGDYTIIVWAGRADGSPSPGAYGRGTAAPILFQIFGLLPADTRAPPPIRPLNMARLSPGLRQFGATDTQTTPPPRIIFPPENATLDSSSGAVTLEAAGGQPPYRWYVNGTMLPAAPVGLNMFWHPDGPGFARISVVDRNDHAVSENIRLQ